MSESMTKGKSIAVARSPLRISLAGGGSDVVSYASRFGSDVVGLAINKYVTVTIHPNQFEGSIKAYWEKAEHAENLEALENSFGKFALMRSGHFGNTQVMVQADAPSGTGLGGSGAFLVSMIHAGRIANNQSVDKGELAEAASSVEIDDLKRMVGKQDHYMASLGGLQHLSFNTNLEADTSSLNMGKNCIDYFNNRLLLFYTGQRRNAGEILKDQASSVKVNNSSTIERIHKIRELVPDMLHAIRCDNPCDIGPILLAHWREKVGLGKKVGNSFIANCEELAMKNGADGFKLLGAGGGGFILISSKPGYQEQLRRVFSEAGLSELPFQYGNSGTMATSLPL
ncbi:hypothetical protein C9J03_25510 [Photobacterium gaetbulicola]|uniref:Putative kinase, GHMP family n=1 Tax=Photobacterium gaetbulicola Gung47 TaxID=658445 RepID=A0A0C5WEG1_9GAMM|nr:hypothetical protein [Photobacterium gaetbulicola]AJR05498.1 putative kinase, GHMP family [Photobacterium gaetbulicola Gung47]PST99760.1 hypothetical protein C9J03_25510 [Photobacterium gaetbulicola]